MLFRSQSGVQTARLVARKRLGYAVRDSSPPFPRSCVVEEVSWEAPFETEFAAKGSPMRSQRRLGGLRLKSDLASSSERLRVLVAARKVLFTPVTCC